MAIVPSERSLISTDVPSASVPIGSAGLVGEAIAGAGNQVSQASQGLLRQVKEAEARDASSKAYYDDLVQEDDYRSKLKLASPDGYVKDDQGGYKTNPDGTRRTITQEYRDWANDRYSKNQQAMPSAMAQDMYRQRSGGFYAEQMTKVHNDEQVLKTSAFSAGLDGNLQKLSDQLVTTPELDRAYRYSNDLTLDIQAETGKLISSPAAKEKISKFNQQIAESSVKGGYNQVLSDISTTPKGQRKLDSINYWRSVLAGTDRNSLARKQAGQPTLSDMLDPDKKAALDEGFVRLQKLAQEHDKSDLTAQLKEAKSAYQSGNGNRVPLDYLHARLDQSVRDGTLTPFEASVEKGELIGAQKVGALSDAKFALLPPAQRDQVAKQSADTAYSETQKFNSNSPIGQTAGSTVENQTKSVIMRASDQILGEETNDFAAYAETYHPGVQQAMQGANFSDPASLGKNAPQIQASLRASKDLYDSHFPGNPQYWRVISKDRSQTLGKTLMDPTYNTQSTAQAVKALQSAYGSKYPELIEQMVKDKNLDERWTFAALLPNSLGTEDMVGALKGRNDIFQKSFDQIAKANGQKESDFESAVARNVSKYTTAMAQQSPNDVRTAQKVEALNYVVRTKAMQLYTQTGGAMDPDTASKQAVDAIVNRNVNLVEAGYANGRKAILAIPKRVGNVQVNQPQVDQIVHWTESHISPEEVKKLGVVPPPQSDGRPSQFDDKFYDQVAQTGSYRVNTDQQNLVLWYEDRAANKVVMAHVKDRNGQPKPLMVPLEQAMTPPPKPVQRRPKPNIFEPIGIPTTPLEKW